MHLRWNEVAERTDRDAESFQSPRCDVSWSRALFIFKIDKNISNNSVRGASALRRVLQFKS